MGLRWPGIQTHGSELEQDEEGELKELLDEFADAVAERLPQVGLTEGASPLWRPWNLYTMTDAERVIAVFTQLSGGIASVHHLARHDDLFPPEALAAIVQRDTGQVPTTVVVLPRPSALDREEGIVAAADRHAQEIERAMRLGRLGDLSGVQHLEPHLRTFLDDHPEPSRNVFVMMRFMQSEQLGEIFEAVRSTLADHGFTALRADDRDYTGELWSNVQVYMTGCQLGIAVFEDIEQRDFNPNVSLELGYMLAKERRCLILKEQRLPDLPADVVHRLYKQFDMFDIERSVSREVARWVAIDIGVGAPDA